MALLQPSSGCGLQKNNNTELELCKGHPYHFLHSFLITVTVVLILNAENINLIHS